MSDLSVMRPVGIAPGLPPLSQRLISRYRGRPFPDEPLHQSGESAVPRPLRSRQTQGLGHQGPPDGQLAYPDRVQPGRFATACRERGPIGGGEHFGQWPLPRREPLSHLAHRDALGLASDAPRPARRRLGLDRPVAKGAREVFPPNLQVRLAGIQPLAVPPQSSHRQMDVSQALRAIRPE